MCERNLFAVKVHKKAKRRPKKEASILERNLILFSSRKLVTAQKIGRRNQYGPTVFSIISRLILTKIGPNSHVSALEIQLIVN